MTDPAPVHVSHALGLDLCGHVLDGRYQITTKIGTGGMAIVYEGRRVGLDRPVAVKILRPELAQNEHNVRRFLREARAAAAIVHPNIVTIVDVGESSRPVYFVMERLYGTDLRALLRREPRLPWPRARDLVLQICAALSAAHARGIVHRDVKPANCMIVVGEDGREQVKVLDFGIAKVLEDAQDLTANVTATHGIVGTVAYMAPEQARGGAIDARTDVYAVGTLIYEMLTGQVPFPDRNPFVAIGRQLTETPAPLRSHRPDVASDVESVVMTCLEKDPDARFQGMDALGGALLACESDNTFEVLARVHAPSEPLALPRPTDFLDPTELGSERETNAPLPRADSDAPRSQPRAEASTVSPDRTRARAGWVGIAIGGIGMVAVGGTVAWWMLFGQRSRDLPAVTSPTVVEPSASVAAPIPTAPIIVTVPGPGVPTPVLVPTPPGDSTGSSRPSDAPAPVHRDHPDKAGDKRTAGSGPISPVDTAPKQPSGAPQPKPRKRDPASDISPDLRNPFARPR